MSQFVYPPGTTPLDPNEIAGLKLDYITTQGELNAAEQANILQGEKWIFSKPRKNFLEEKFLRQSHEKMFGNVWKWAGTYRTTDKSIGVRWHFIPAEIQVLLGDVRYWIENKTYPIDEIAARYHHRLVLIHPFPNGNGRWARCMADILLMSLGQPRFSWGSKSSEKHLNEKSSIRDRYIRSLQLADVKKFEALLEFVRS